MPDAAPSDVAASGAGRPRRCWRGSRADAAPRNAAGGTLLQQRLARVPGRHDRGTFRELRRGLILRNRTHLNSRIQVCFGEERIRILSEFMTLSSVIKNPFRRTGRRVGGSDVVGKTPRRPSQMVMWQVVPLSRNDVANMSKMCPGMSSRALVTRRVDQKHILR